MAALKVAIRNLADRYGCSAGAIQCWNALQGEIGIMPCAANALLNEEGRILQITICQIGKGHPESPQDLTGRKNTALAVAQTDSI